MRHKAARFTWVLMVGVWAASSYAAEPALPSTEPSAAGDSRPNVLFILSDQYRWDCVGVAGNAKIHTPNLDRLARQGAWFNRCYAAQPVCSPNRAAILTGLYPHTAGVPDNCTGGRGGERSLPASSRTLSEMLAPAGYDCGYFGKWHLGRHDAFETFPDYLADGRGRNHYFGEGADRRYAVDVITEDSIAFLKRPRSRPFFLYVSFYPPHPPFSVPPEYVGRYSGITDREQRIYYAMCTKVDEKVGELLAALDELRLADKTVVVFTSDHGHNFIKRWNQHNKRLCYDTAARVPLIMRFPGVIPRGRRIDGLISSVDLTPTLLGFLGRPVPPVVQGKDLSGLARGRTDRGRRYVFIENVPYPFNPSKGEERCVFDGQFKLILSTQRQPELIDVKSDPAEARNEWERMKDSDTANRLLGALADWGSRTADKLAPRLVASVEK